MTRLNYYNMKYISLHSTILFLAFLLAACSENPENDVSTSNDEASTEASPDELEESPELEESAEERAWGVYAGKLGLYEQEVVMELIISGDKVSGSYFYAKHQKALQLDGTYDKASQKFVVTESYKGKATGYMEFDLIKGELNGFWMKKAGSKEKEDFKATLLPVDEKEFKVVHSVYESKHEMTIYNATEEAEVEMVTDILKVSQLGKGLFAFYYSVIGGTGHLGSLDGLGETRNGKSTFQMDECELQFDFSSKNAEVHESGDCQYYRGARVYFEGSLKKIR